ncbi:MAG TPA: glycerol-3-phosphate cytidylyltransferase [Candidatus Saccharimonadales bacterium]
MKTVLTYGTFDLLHYGHIEILRRAKSLAQGGKLIVAISSDEFNALKGKKAHMPFEKRKELVEAIRYVDQVIAENTWEQKKEDVQKYNVDIFVMGNDWEGKFDELKEFCDVHYLPRTPSVSSTALRKIISELEEVENETLS